MADGGLAPLSRLFLSEPVGSDPAGVRGGEAIAESLGLPCGVCWKFAELGVASLEFSGDSSWDGT